MDESRPRAAPPSAADRAAGAATRARRTERRLDALLRATQAVAQPIELADVLEQIVRAALDLVDAEYGALGVVAPHGGLEQFIHVGMASADVAAIGHLPEGHGVLGALIEDPRPIRLDRIHEDPRSAGFPAGHPEMDGFLGVPIRVRDEVFGNLYLANPRRGFFFEEDQDLVVALATTAGSALANARRYEEARARQRWTAAAVHVTEALLDGTGTDSVTTLADELVARADADRICIVRAGPEAGTVLVLESRGDAAAEVAGRVLCAPETAAAGVLGSGVAVALPGGPADAADALALADETGAGPAMFIPMRHVRSRPGVLVVARRRGRPHFTATELDIAGDLVARADLAVELAAAREQRRRAELAEDRARIARDLHDRVIQQLYGGGLELQAVASAADLQTAPRLQAVAELLDASIQQIRTIIFAMRPREGVDTLRHRLLDIAAQSSGGRREPIGVELRGPVDTMIAGELADDVEAVARELLTNAVRHASAGSIRLAVTVAGDGVEVRTDDDGIGIPRGVRRSGLDNLVRRARHRGGDLRIVSRPGRTTVRWSAPVLEGSVG